MADSVLKSYLVSLGFQVKGGNEFKRSLKDYEAAVVQAEKAIEDARWAGATTQEEIAKLTRETNLKLAREALAQAQTREKAEAEAAKKRKADAEAVAAALGKVALAAAAAATAIGYAVEKITKSFDNLYFQAQRSGTSVESLRAIGHAFSQTGGSAQQAQASVDSFTAKIRNNPGLRGFVQELGVDDKLGGVDKYLATLDAIKAKTADSPGVGVQYAEQLGISEENYNQFLRQGDAIKAYKKEYDALAAKLKFNSDAAAEGATAFQRSLGRLAATAGIVVDKLLTALAPALKEIVDRFQAWIEANPGALERILTNIAKAAIAVAEAIGRFLTSITGGDGDEAVKMWDAFAERAERMARSIENIVLGLEKILRFLGLINDKEVSGAGVASTWLLNKLSGGTVFPNEPGGANTGKDVPPDERTTLQKVLPKALGGRDAPRAGDGSRAWRNNNPGNIKFGRLARSLGATEADADGFARFPSYDAGRKAQEKLLFESAGYKDKTIRSAIARWAPGLDGNDPEGYAGILAKAAGVPVDTPLASLTPEQRGRLLDAQQRKEGWTPGSAAIAPGVQKGGESASYLRGQISFDGQSYDYGSGNGRGKNSIPIGTYPITPGTIGPWGQAHDALGINNNQIWDKALGRMRDGIEFHAASNANMMTAGCIGIAKEQYGKFREHVLAYVKKNGAAYLTVRPDGSAAITSTPPGREEGARTTQIGAPKPRFERPIMTPGGFDVNAATRPSSPAGIGGGSNSTSTSNDNRAVHQTFHSQTTVTGVEKPADHAAVLGRVERDNHALALQNAQSAIA